uniref:CMP-N-acetylneuraminate-poly-alpha-2, 8-sialyltransferase-like isoform X2 n=1 Tax=Myxine glutinosa TaxID=7769 RepID=UPI00358E1854
MRFCSTLPLALCALSALSLLVSFFVCARGPRRASAPAPAALPRSHRYEASPSPSSIPSSWHDDVSLVTVNDNVSSSWHFNATLAESIRKDVLRFLDSERDMFLLQREVKPGARIPYILNRGHLATVTRTLHSLLPSAPLLRGRRFASCALVGNSGILRGSHCGSEIDRHDYVVRCNMAPVTPFKRDVGVRTDFLTMNPSILPRFYGGLRNATLHDHFVARLRALGKGILWIPAFMVPPERRWVDAATELIAHERLSLHTAVPSLRLNHAVRGF